MDWKLSKSCSAGDSSSRFDVNFSQIPRVLSVYGSCGLSVTSNNRRVYKNDDSLFERRGKRSHFNSIIECPFPCNISFQKESI